MDEIRALLEDADHTGTVGPLYEADEDGRDPVCSEELVVPGQLVEALAKGAAHADIDPVSCPLSIVCQILVEVSSVKVVLERKTEHVDSTALAPAFDLTQRAKGPPGQKELHHLTDVGIASTLVHHSGFFQE